MQRRLIAVSFLLFGCAPACSQELEIAPTLIEQNLEQQREEVQLIKPGFTVRQKGLTDTGGKATVTVYKTPTVDRKEEPLRGPILSDDEKKRGLTPYDVKHKTFAYNHPKLHKYGRKIRRHSQTAAPILSAGGSLGQIVFTVVSFFHR